jgi:hypothetical protein
MSYLARKHQALTEEYHWHLQITADKLLAQPSWSLEATMALIHIQEQGITIGPVGNLSGWLDHAPPAFDAYVRMQEQGVSVKEAYQRCLEEQGQEFLDACAFVKATGALVSYNNLAEFAALSQKGFARDPKELLALACAGPIGGVALARISVASAYGKAHGQTTGALRACSLSSSQNCG